MRYYNKWAGEPKGTPEDPGKCIVEVPVGGRSVLYHQCFRKNGHGPHGRFCKQHGDMMDRGVSLYIPKDEEEK